MIKRIATSLFIVTMFLSTICIPVVAYSPGDQIGWVLYTDIVAYIDGVPIRSYNINGNTYIVAEDLISYGFGVVWDGTNNRLNISTARVSTDSIMYKSTYIPADVTQVPGTNAMPYVHTNITTWIGNSKVNSYNIGGFTCICMDDLASYFADDYIWVQEERALKMTSKNQSSLKIELNKDYSYLQVGKSEKLEAVIISEDSISENIEWASSNEKIATVVDGEVFAKSEGTVFITASCGGASKNCIVTVSQYPMLFSGHGDSVITDINLPMGVYYVEYTNAGNRNFIANLYYGDGLLDFDLVANDIGPCSGRMAIVQALENDIVDGMIDITADGDWTILINKMSTTTSTNLSGKGSWVCGFFTANKVRNICTYTNNGNRNFIVNIYDKYGDWILAANDIGPCSGKNIVSLVVGREYFFEIIADGEWTLDLDMGDSLVIVGSSSN